MFPTIHGVASQITVASGGGGGGGADYATDFGEYTTGQAPNDWNVPHVWVELDVVEEEGSISGKHLNAVLVGNSTRIIRWTAVEATSQDVEVLALVRYSSSSSVRKGGIFVRGDMADGTTGYALATENGTGEQGQLYRITSSHNSGLTQIGDPFTPDLPDGNVWGWWRFRVEGDSLHAKSWLLGAEEPGEWHATEADANLTEAGSVGVVLNRSSSSDAELDIGYFAVKFGGGSVPVPS